jgi:hypothetical protein
LKVLTGKKEEMPGVNCLPAELLKGKEEVYTPLPGADLPADTGKTANQAHQSKLPISRQLRILAKRPVNGPLFFVRFLNV